jgi:hypothetical protein
VFVFRGGGVKCILDRIYGKLAVLICLLLLLLLLLVDSCFFGNGLDFNGNDDKVAGDNLGR